MQCFENKHFIELIISTLSGILVLGIPALIKIFCLRPKLSIDFLNDIAPFLEHNGDKQIVTSKVYQLQVRNNGNVTLDEPRVWCLSIRIKDANEKLIEFPITPFELDWSDTDKNLQIGAVFPGDFSYKINLLQENIAGNSEITIPRRDKNILKPIILNKGLEHHICIIISNTNFLVPAHFAHMKISWNTKSEIDVKVLHQSDFYDARFLGKVRIFENLKS